MAGGRLAVEPRDGGVEGAGGRQRVRGSGRQPAGETARGPDRDRGLDVAAGRRRREVVADVEADRPARGQREAVVVGLVDLDVEADQAAGEAPGHPRADAGREAGGVEVDVEGDGRQRATAPGS
jgi:hypothetical protein